MKHSHTQRKILGLGIVLSSLFLTGCFLPNSKTDTTNSKQNSLQATVPFTPYTPPSPTPTSTPTNTPSNLSPTFSVLVEGYGYNGPFEYNKISGNFTVNAKKTLKIRFTPGVQNRSTLKYPYSPTYSKLGLFIKVGSKTVQTPLLQNGATQTAQWSSVYDFSSEVNASGNVTITVERPNYDYWCLNFAMYCPNTWVDANHPWSGTLEIETENTQVIQ